MKQHTISSSIVESKYWTTASPVSELVWLLGLLEDLTIEHSQPTLVTLPMLGNSVAHFLARCAEGTHTRKVSEATPIPTKTFTPQEVATPPATVQTEVASPVTPLVISTSDPFAVLSQAVKDGSSLVVTPSSIPSSATCGLVL